MEITVFRILSYSIVGINTFIVTKQNIATEHAYFLLVDQHYSPQLRQVAGSNETNFRKKTSRKRSQQVMHLNKTRGKDISF